MPHTNLHKLAIAEGMLKDHMQVHHTVQIFIYSHHFIVPNNLDSGICVSTSSILDPHHITEHTLSCEAKHCVSLVQDLSYSDPYK